MNAPIYAGLLSFFVAVLLGPSTISFLRRLKFGQHIRSAGPKAHLGKAGTPTMGGVLIVFAAVVATLVFAEPGSGTALRLILVTLAFALIGLVDDFIIVVRKRSLGLRARSKLAAQLVIAAWIALYALNTPGLGPEVIVPFTGDAWELSPLLFFLLCVVAVAGTANAANFTDGLDGLAAGTSAIACIIYTVIALRAGQPDAAVFAAAVAGACLGFAWFNAHPAQVFMGDTGALALGGAIGALAVLTRTQLALPIIVSIFLVEILSVMIQVPYFRLTKGKRIFKMTPIHHHFEESGWAETKIVVRFWLLAAVSGVIGLLSLA
ncbi:MAG: phospho-N-acetylmuramoyl-pentapeptide-transferase [Clostridia bacterium]|nr:phospho-N-acetylmuramoyl-pentapeptide-transferase [Bacillota bacterium]MBO2520545.1 phospho-N-acetylmuramoyl-pentapeptide-transferase [Bacillota bacterium]